MTGDGWVRYTKDSLDALQKKNEQRRVEAASAQPSVQVAIQPQVDVNNQIVTLWCGMHHYRYKVLQVSKVWYAAFIDKASKPIPGTDGNDKGLLLGATQTFMQAAGLTTTGKFRIDYRAKLNPKTRLPLDDLPKYDALYVRALMRLDNSGAGVVVASHADVVCEMAVEDLGATRGEWLVEA